MSFLFKILHRFAVSQRISSNLLNMAMRRSLLIFSLLTFSVSYYLLFPICFTLFLICMPCSCFLSFVCHPLSLSTLTFTSLILTHSVITCSRNPSPTQPSKARCHVWRSLPQFPVYLREPLGVLEDCHPGEEWARTGRVGFLHHSIQSSSPRTWSFPFLFSLPGFWQMLP